MIAPMQTAFRLTHPDKIFAYNTPLQTQASLAISLQQENQRAHLLPSGPATYAQALSAQGV